MTRLTQDSARSLEHVGTARALGQTVGMPRLKITKLEWVLLEALAAFVLARWAVLGISAVADKGHVDGWLLHSVGAFAAAMAAGFRWHTLSKRVETDSPTARSR